MMHLSDDLPPDPFGIKAAEVAAWQAFGDSGAMDALLDCVGRDKPTSRREIEVYPARRRGHAVPAGARPLTCIETLCYFLRPAEANGVDTSEVLRALEAWRTARTGPMPFMTGRCHEFAIAGHQITDWPIGILTGPNICNNGNIEALHLFLIPHDGQVLDALGLRPLEAVAAFYGLQPDAVQVIDQDTVLARHDLSPVKSLAEAEEVFLRVVGDALSPEVALGM